MRLVVATPLYPPEIGGPATYAKNLEDGLPGEGIDVIVVKFADVRGWPKLLRHYIYERNVAKALTNADAVLALDPVSVGLPALAAAKKAKKPFFVKIVGDYAWEQGTQRFGITASLDEFVKTPDASLPLPVRMLRGIQRHVARSAKHVIVPSEYLKGIVVAWGIDAGRISVIYNGIDIPADVGGGVVEGAFAIVSYGRRVPWKGFEALERVAATRARDGWHVSILSDIPRAEGLRRMNVADVFVLNSTYEGLSHTLIEVMMLGTPIIATNVGGNPELIEHGVTGLLIPPCDDEALLNALDDVWRNPAAARTRADAAVHKAHATFTVPHMITTTAAFLQQHV